MNYGEKFKKLGDSLGLTQKDFANIIGLDNTLYNKYENDYNTIPLRHLITICNYFNVSLDYIFDFSSDKNYENIALEIDKIKAGKRLKDFRKEKNLTQIKLANYLKTVRSVIADYERGRFLISTSFLYTICQKYNISADYLLGRIDTPKYLK